MSENNDLKVHEKRESGVEGRRHSDMHKCAMHDFVMEKNEDWFSWIKKTVEINDTKITRRFEIMEQSLSKYITKWAVGTILTVVAGLLGAILILGRWQVQSVHEDVLILVESVRDVGDSQNDLNIDQAKFSVIQQNVLNKMEALERNQEDIANDVFNMKNDLDYDREKEEK